MSVHARWAELRRVSLVGDGPHDDARMVLIAADELGQHLHVTHQRLAHLRAAKHTASTSPHS
eukprot:6205942-Pleurochrysis_carterae.AAC.1